MEDKDKVFMKRALELAINGGGHVSPNPMVGCVVVHDDLIIGEGWHRQYGKAHAEVNAINDVKDKSLLPESTVYVTLEPCSHFGNTPPCVDLLINAKVKRVVICNNDPNPKVSGRGIIKLKEHGIEVKTDVLKEQGDKVNKRFFTYHNKKRPFIILKWAQTSDGFIARENFDSKWISNQYSRQLVHRWRAEEDAIMVGTNTAFYDDPSLNIRDSFGKNPLRVVIDKNLRLSKNLKLFNQEIPTVCYNNLKNESLKNLDYVQVSSESLLPDMLDDLYDRNILSVIVEGGTSLINLFIESGLWDEARIFLSKKTFGNGLHAPRIINGTLISTKNIVDDSLLIYTKAYG